MTVASWKIYLAAQPVPPETQLDSLAPFRNGGIPWKQAIGGYVGAEFSLTISLVLTPIMTAATRLKSNGCAGSSGMDRNHTGATNSRKPSSEARSTASTVFLTI